MTEPQCDSCPFRGSIKVPYTKKPKTASLIVVGEAPGADEVDIGRYFIGASGDFFNKMCDRWNIPRSRISEHNACLCRPKFQPSPKQWAQALECCWPRLEAELKRHQCRVILAFGKRALQVLTGKKGRIFDWMGAPLETRIPKKQVVGTLHPAFCLRPDGRNWSAVPFIHLGRAWALANGELKPWKWPRIITKPNKEAVSALEEMLDGKKPVGFDVETRGTNPLESLCMCVGLANEQVAVSVSWEGYTARRGEVVQPIGQTPTGRKIARLVRAVLADEQIGKVFQNGPHDILTGKRVGLEVHNYQFDTLLAHAIIWQGIRHSLSVICGIEFHAPRWKTEFHATTKEKGLAAFARREPETLRIYNAKDAWMTVKLLEPLSTRLDDTHNGWELFDSYMTNIKIAMKMQERGVQIDTSQFKRHRLLIGRRRSAAKMEYKRICEAVKCFKGFNPNKPSFNRQLFFNRFHVRPRYFSEKTGAPSLNEKALSEMVSHPNAMVSHAARALLRYRRWNKLISTYIDGLPLDINQMVHPTWNVHGARTLRWSCQDPNLMNVPKGLRDIVVGHST